MRKALWAILMLLLVSAAVWAMAVAAPGGRAAALLGDVSEEDLASFGDDYPGYFEWLGKAVRLDFGQSSFGGEGAASLVLSRVFPSLVLSLSSLVFALVFTCALVAWAEVGSSRAAKWVRDILPLVSLSSPGFALAILLVMVFSLQLGLLPPGGWTSPSEDFSRFLSQMVLPTISLGFLHSGLLVRMATSSLKRELSENYANEARAKGAGEASVVFLHCGRNILPEMLTLSFQSLASMFTSSAAVETVFSIPGLGSLAVAALARRDANTLVALVMAGSVFTCLCSFLADVLSAAADRRLSGAP